VKFCSSFGDVSRRPRHEGTRGRIAPALDAVDRTLAGIAGTAERLPIMRTADRPETRR
jgi:hypothetical protein